jgi:hypothetical protein
MTYLIVGDLNTNGILMGIMCDNMVCPWDFNDGIMA